MNAGLIILRVASLGRDAQNEEASIHFPPCRLKFQWSRPTVLGHPSGPVMIIILIRQRLVLLLVVVAQLGNILYTCTNCTSSASFP